MIRNHRTPEGAELGEHLARLCDAAEPEARLKIPQLPPRCNSCALRKGRHIPNQSPYTLMDVMKCVMEDIPFHCHEYDRPCMGWMYFMLTREGGDVLVPWEFTNKP